VLLANILSIVRVLFHVKILKVGETIFSEEKLEIVSKKE